MPADDQSRQSGHPRRITWALNVHFLRLIATLKANLLPVHHNKDTKTRICTARGKNKKEELCVCSKAPQFYCLGFSFQGAARPLQHHVLAPKENQ